MFVKVFSQVPILLILIIILKMYFAVSKIVRCIVPFIAVLCIPNSLEVMDIGGNYTHILSVKQPWQILVN